MPQLRAVEALGPLSSTKGCIARSAPWTHPHESSIPMCTRDEKETRTACFAQAVGATYTLVDNPLFDAVLDFPHHGKRNCVVREMGNSADGVTCDTSKAAPDGSRVPYEMKDGVDLCFIMVVRQTDQLDTEFYGLYTYVLREDNCNTPLDHVELTPDSGVMSRKKLFDISIKAANPAALPH